MMVTMKYVTLDSNNMVRMGYLVPASRLRETLESVARQRSVVAKH